MAVKMKIRRQVAADLISAYLDAKEAVLAAGFAEEIDWQHDLAFERIEESDFLREAAWVILASGMRETIIRRKFDDFTQAFLGWESAEAIIRKKDACRTAALRCFANTRKVDGILLVAEHVASVGYLSVKRSIEKSGLDYLERFPFIGPITRYHLAKNIGLDVVKPDRHLVRMSKASGFFSADAMCRTIAELVGEKAAVVDIVLWRFATFDRSNVTHFSKSCPQRII
jgi:hypothetical protein